MLPILNAIAFVRQFKKHSRTQPWVILANELDLAPEPYVVKLYTRQENEDRHVVAKEVFCNVIARQLGLHRPDAALIDFYSNDFMSNLNDGELTSVNEKDNRIKFASKLVPNHTQFPEKIEGKFFNQFTLTDSIFAFDNLVLNTDRNFGKPNVLLKDRNIILIDHEFTLNVTQQVLDEYDNGTWAYNCVTHILFNYLSSYYRSQFFSEFSAAITTFNPDILDPYAEQLRGLGYDPPYENYQLLKEYLTRIQNNPAKFTNILKAKVR